MDYEFKVGDKVRVKAFDESWKHWEWGSVILKSQCGCEGTIIDIDDEGDMTLGGFGGIFRPDMIELVEEKVTTNEVDFNYIESTFNEIYDILIDKNTAYGNSFHKSLDEYGHVAFFTRFDDKYNRLKSLLLQGNENNVDDETVNDTICDAIGYLALFAEYLQ